MDEKYVGRICPYCKQPIHESDEIMVCERCGTAMHKICRQQAGKCVAVGCSDAAPPEESTGSVEAPKSAPLEKQDEPTAHAAMPQRTTEEIFRNPSFCPSCGAAVPSGAESCRQCGFRFASHPAADPAKPGKKIKKSLIALIVCLVLAVAVAAGGIGGKAGGFNIKKEQLLQRTDFCQVVGRGKGDGMFNLYHRPFLSSLL